MMAAFKQALEDFSKGPEASKVLEGASPLGALLEFGKQALAKAGVQPPSPVAGTAGVTVVLLASVLHLLVPPPRPQQPQLQPPPPWPHRHQDKHGAGSP